MSKHEWRAKQYGVLLEDGSYKEFADLESATNEVLYLEFRGIPCEMASREVHTTVTDTPWVTIPSRTP